MRASSMCFACMFGKQDRLIRSFEDEDKKSEYLHEALGILYQYGPSESSPRLAERLNELYESYWGPMDDAPLKHQYNQLLLAMEKDIEQRIRDTDDPLKTCIQYVCAGNYIDFSAVEHVNEREFEELLAARQAVPEEEYGHFLHDLEAARQLTYLTDNCGEIVLDKLFIRFIKERYPSLQIHVIVRGRDVLNDATMVDAREVGLTELVPCIGNGNGAPGSVIERFGQEARQLLLGADLVIAKGQGNFESLYGEGVNPYYFFLCKCELFVRRFGLKRYESVFVKEERIRSLIEGV